jgi:hypothetical protein
MLLLRRLYHLESWSGQLNERFTVALRCIDYVSIGNSKGGVPAFG